MDAITKLEEIDREAIYSDTELCSEYWKLDSELYNVKTDMKDDSAALEESIKKLQEALSEIKSRYQPTIKQIEGDMLFCKGLLASRIPEDEKGLFVSKTHFNFVVDQNKSHTKITKKTNKSTVILDKRKVIEFLIVNNKIDEGVNNFYLGFIRKFIDTGIMPKDAAKLESNTTISISTVEEKSTTEYRRT